MDVIYISLSSSELILTLVEAARSPDTVTALELHGNKRMIGSGIKGLIHYLFSYGHFREVPTLCECVCVLMAHSCLTHRSMLPTAHLGKDSNLQKSKQRL